VALDTATEKLREYYGQMGYQNIQVEALRAPNFQTGAIAVTFKIQEGERFTVRSLDIQGNTKTRSTVIARELALSPGEVFDLARVRVSEARLRNTQFFEEVRLVPVPSPVPNQSDLRVIVKEGSTGSVSFGAGYSTVEQLVGFVEYSEGNFDFTNPEGWYRGGGQKFRVKLQAGSVSNAFEHSFEEPALWERDLAVGYKIERRYTGYSSANYNVVNEGVGVYARRRLFGNVEGRIAYDLRRVSVGDVTPTAPLDVQAEDGHPKTISSVTLSLTQDTRDEYNFPTKGTRLSLSEEIAGNGLGGTLDYFRTELRTGKWFLLSQTAEQTLGLIGRVGTIAGSGGNLPFYERFYLGGAYDMRGFDYNDVGAASTWDTTNGNQPVGGLTYGYLSAEYTIKAADNLRLAAFYDYGFVNKEAARFSLSEANSDVGVGLRILLGGAVMRLDFGFPLQTTINPATGAELNGGGMKFNFSFGTVF
jgi:outer membrane protein insertion porin family